MSLKGQKGRVLAASLSDDAAAAARWAAAAIRSTAAVGTVAIYYDGATILREGVLGDAAVDAAAPTFRSALSDVKETYAPDLQAVPARVDFGCLPRNAQAALIQPFSNGAVVCGCDRKRGLSPRDVAKIRAVALRLGDRLSAG